jgi:SET and MYND domain-containing protein
MHAPPTPPTPPRAPWPIALADIPGRGKGVVATREIRPGECVLEERATMTGVSESHRATTCAGCLRRAARCVRTRACERCGEVLLCDDCHRAAELAFGADDARLAMAPNAHTRVKCRGEAVGASAALSTGDRERFRFLVACAELRAMKTMRAETQAREDDRGFDDVASLCPREDDDGGGSWPIASHVDAATRLHPLLFATMHDADIERGVLKVNGASLSSDDFERMYVGTIRENAMLLAKESKNAFGVMAAAAADERDENDFGAARSVRGGALYRDASRVNHGCFPNVARFDNFDDDFLDPSKAFSSPSSLSALCEPSTLRLLAIDVIPAGAEVLMRCVLYTGSHTTALAW